MPTVFRERGFRFFFYSNEGFEPCHVHVAGHGGEAKFWVPSCQLVWSSHLNANQLRQIFGIIKGKSDLIEDKWNEHFKPRAG